MDISQSFHTVIENDVSYNFLEALKFSVDYSSNENSVSEVLNFSENSNHPKRKEVYVEEKRVMSIALMGTILDSLVAINRKKLSLILISYFQTWRSCSPNVKSLAPSFKKSLNGLFNILQHCRASRIAEAFFLWKTCTLLVPALQQKKRQLMLAKKNYREKEKELDFQQNYIKNSIADKEKAFELVRGKMKNLEGRAKDPIEELRLENEQLRKQVAWKEQTLLNYFNELSAKAAEYLNRA